MARPIYARIADLRAAGLTDTIAFPDDRCLDLLELASEIVESLTRQFFGPKKLTVLGDGLGRRAVEEECRNKIIEVQSLARINQDGTKTAYDTNEYAVIDQRAVRLHTIDTDSSPYRRAFRAAEERRFPYDDQNVELVGIFGWLERTTKHSTTLAAALAKGDLSISLVAAGDVELHDLLFVDSKFWVIAGTSPALGVFSIDPSPGAAAVGTSVVRYGKVPRLLREAVLRTAIANKLLPGSDAETQTTYNQRIRREETDNYEIEFYQGPTGNRVFNGTGDARADTILSRFRAPPIAGAWV